MAQIFRFLCDTALHLGFVASQIATLGWNAIVTVARWKYFWHAAVGVIAISVAVSIYRSYRRWRKGWLSDFIEDTLVQMRRKRRRDTPNAIERNLSLKRTKIFSTKR
jgi:hypothetical protein